jgi:hypothetical protein
MVNTLKRWWLTSVAALAITTAQRRVRRQAD